MLFTYHLHDSYFIFMKLSLFFEAYKKYFFVYIKIVNNYCQKNKEKLRKEARERYQTLSEEEKDKRQKKTPRRKRKKGNNII